MSKWTDTVTEVYKINRAKNSSYKFKQAMKDAKKVYKKGSKGEGEGEGKSRRHTKRRGHGRRSKTSRMRGGQPLAATNALSPQVVEPMNNNLQKAL